AQVRRAALAGLGGDDGPVAPIADRAADEPLALAVAVGFRGVDQRDACVERAVDGEDASLVVPGVVPASERHGAERDRADAHLALAELASVDHRASVAPSTVHTGRRRASVSIISESRRLLSDLHCRRYSVAGDRGSA